MSEWIHACDAARSFTTHHCATVDSMTSPMLQHVTRTAHGNSLAASTYLGRPHHWDSQLHSSLPIRCTEILHTRVLAHNRILLLGANQAGGPQLHPGRVVPDMLAAHSLCSLLYPQRAILTHPNPAAPPTPDLRRTVHERRGSSIVILP